MKLGSLNKILIFISASSFGLELHAATPLKVSNSKESVSSQHFTLRIDKMMCGSCTSRVKKTIQSHSGTSNVTVTLDDHLANFNCNKANTKDCDIEKIVKDLKKIGYPSKIVSNK